MRVPGGLVSVDDHLLEPPNLWVNHGRASFDGRYPVAQLVGETPGWMYEGKWFPIPSAAACAGMPREDCHLAASGKQMPKGAYDPWERLNDMDADGVAASLCYPTLCGLGGEFFLKAQDKEAAAEGIDAYNRFILREWTPTSPSRFIPAVILPLWDVALSVRRAEEAIRDGARAILFPQAVHQFDCPPHWFCEWDPLFAFLEEAGVPLCSHILSEDLNHTAFSSVGAPYWGLAMGHSSAIETIGSWVMTDVLDRHPQLKIMVAEGGVGWLPWFSQMSNTVYRLHRHDFGPMSRLPSEKIAQNIGVSLMAEQVALGTLQSLPSLDNLMFQTDYPHLDGSWPCSGQAFEALGLPAWLAPKVGRTNAEQFFNFSAYRLPDRDDDQGSIDTGPRQDRGPVAGLGDLGGASQPGC
jgi:predicted TIM-barrel fold metal-dependent hydrolase